MTPFFRSCRCVFSHVPSFAPRSSCFLGTSQCPSRSRYSSSSAKFSSHCASIGSHARPPPRAAAASASRIFFRAVRCLFSHSPSFAPRSSCFFGTSQCPSRSRYSTSSAKFSSHCASSTSHVTPASSSRRRRPSPNRPFFCSRPLRRSANSRASRPAPRDSTARRSAARDRETPAAAQTWSPTCPSARARSSRPLAAAPAYRAAPCPRSNYEAKPAIPRTSARDRAARPRARAFSSSRSSSSFATKLASPRRPW